MKRTIALVTLALPLAFWACKTNDAGPATTTATETSASNTTAANAAPATDTTAAAPAPTTPAAPEDELATAKRITVPELKAKLAAGQAVIVDVRPADQYAASHIEGAINIPLGELATRAGELPKDKFIATYCT